MTINRDLRDAVIKEYVEKNGNESSKMVNDNMKKATVIMVAIFGVVFLVQAYIYLFVGRFSDASMVLSMGLIISLPLVLFASGIVWIALRRETSKSISMNEDILRRTVCSIEDGNLIKRVIGGGGGRPRRFRLEKIRDLSTEDNVVRFYYDNQEIELLDYYDPSLYESLKEMVLSFDRLD